MSQAVLLKEHDIMSAQAASSSTGEGSETLHAHNEVARWAPQK
jgi:hypothetical protein